MSWSLYIRPTTVLIFLSMAFGAHIGPLSVDLESGLSNAKSIRQIGINRPIYSREILYWTYDANEPLEYFSELHTTSEVDSELWSVETNTAVKMYTEASVRTHLFACVCEERVVYKVCRSCLFCGSTKTHNVVPVLADFTRCTLQCQETGIGQILNKTSSETFACPWTLTETDESIESHEMTTRKIRASYNREKTRVYFMAEGEEVACNKQNGECPGMLIRVITEGEKEWQDACTHLTALEDKCTVYRTKESNPKECSRVYCPNARREVVLTGAVAKLPECVGGGLASITTSGMLITPAFVDLTFGSCVERGGRDGDDLRYKLHRTVYVLQQEYENTRWAKDHEPLTDDSDTSCGKMRDYTDGRYLVRAVGGLVLGRRLSMHTGLVIYPNISGSTLYVVRPSSSSQAGHLDAETMVVHPNPCGSQLQVVLVHVNKTHTYVYHKQHFSRVLSKKLLLDSRMLVGEEVEIPGPTQLKGDDDLRTDILSRVVWVEKESSFLSRFLDFMVNWYMLLCLLFIGGPLAYCAVKRKWFRSSPNLPAVRYREGERIVL